MKPVHHCAVEVRLRCPVESMNSVRERLAMQSYLPPFIIDEGELICGSYMSSVDDNLKVLYMQLQCNRKFFRQLGAEGIAVVVSIKVDARFFSITPEALLLAEKLHAVTEVTLSK